MAMYFNVAQLARLIDAETPNGVDERELTDCSIDSRQVSEGSLFVGLPGEQTHGQRFAEQAFARGAGAAIVEDFAAAACQHRPNVLVVPSAEQALQNAARALRRQLDCPLVGITGTNGKTTTKDVVSTVLEQTYGVVHATRGNFNNHLGLPLSLLSMPVEACCGVFELGMSNPGEIDFIASILQPTIGVITNIGEAHLETMKTVEAIVDAKSELLAHLPADGLLLLNADCPWHKRVAKGFAGRLGLVGVSPMQELRRLAAELSQPVVDVSSVTGRLHLAGRACGSVRLPIGGLHVASSFLFAAAIAAELGAEPHELVSALERCRPAWGRMQTSVVNGIQVIFDGYNANPNSVEAALQHVHALSGKRWVVLGSMLELGDREVAAHEQVGCLACQLFGPEQVFLLGELYRGVAAHHPTVQLHTDLNDLGQALRQVVGQGDIVLLKASRGVGIERVLPALSGPGQSLSGSADE